MAERGDPASPRPSGAARGPQAGPGALLGPRSPWGSGGREESFPPSRRSPTESYRGAEGEGARRATRPSAPPPPASRRSPARGAAPSSRCSARPTRGPSSRRTLRNSFPAAPAPNICSENPPPSPHPPRTQLGAPPGPHLTRGRAPGGRGTAAGASRPPAPSSGRRRGAGKGKSARSPRPYLILAEPGSPPPPPAVWAAQAGSPLPSAPPPGAAILAVTGAGGGGRRLVIAGGGLFPPLGTARRPSGGHGAGAEPGGSARLGTAAEEGGSV